VAGHLVSTTSSGVDHAFDEAAASVSKHNHGGANQEGGGRPALVQVSVKEEARGNLSIYTAKAIGRASPSDLKPNGKQRQRYTTMHD